MAPSPTRMRYVYTLLTIVLSFYMPFCHAQEALTEGILVYQVTIDPPANQEGISQYSGTYTITIKGQQVKQALKLDNGFTTTMLYNYKEQTVYSLKKIGDKNLAIQLDMEQVNAKRNKYASFTLKELKEKKDIAGMSASAAIVNYSNGTSNDVWYTSNLVPSQTIFERFPNATFLPLRFKASNDDGLIINFNAEKITLQPVTDAEFRIPAQYKIISNAEYQKLSSK